MRRRVKRIPNTAQQILPMAMPEKQAGAASASGKKARFQDDSTDHLFLGDQRLDEYLKSRGLGWVVSLRRELEQVDCGELEVKYERMGRRPYHPRTLLGLIVYGILEGQWSLRALENLAVRDVGAWWICGGNQPDHSTIGDFINRHAETLSQEFVTTLVKGLVKRMKLKAGIVGIDGTVIEASASHYRKLKAEAAREFAEQAREKAEAEPENEQAQAAADKAREVAKEADRRSKVRARQGKPIDTLMVSPREPEAVLQPRKDGAMRFSYKPTTLVHEQGLILGHVLHPSRETAGVEELVDRHADIFGTYPQSALADAGFCQPEVLGTMVERDVDILCPSGRTDHGEDWEKRGHKGLFAKSKFSYDEERDEYRCPAGERLVFKHQGRDGRGQRYRAYKGVACTGCDLRSRCTTSKTGRKVKRYEGEELKEAMAVVMRHPVARAVYHRRAAIAERPFAEIRERQGLKRFRRCGRLGATVEFALHVIAFDLKWAVSRRQGSGNAFVLVIALAAVYRGHQSPEIATLVIFPASAPTFKTSR